MATPNLYEDNKGKVTKEDVKTNERKIAHIEYNGDIGNYVIHGITIDEVLENGGFMADGYYHLIDAFRFAFVGLDMFHNEIFVVSYFDGMNVGLGYLQKNGDNIIFVPNYTE